MKHSVKLIRENNTYGITLIALVITIIVLLILAGVSIATLTGDNGILTRASDAKIETAIGAVKEALKLEQAGKVIDNKNLTPETLLAEGKVSRKVQQGENDTYYMYYAIKEKAYEGMQGLGKGNVASFKDVFLIDDNLNVKYIASNGKEYGDNLDNKVLDDETNIRFSSKAFSEYVSKISGVTEDEMKFKWMKNQTKLTISDSNVDSLQDLVFFPNLIELNLENLTLENLEGIGNCINLKSYGVGRSNIKDKSELKKLINLKSYSDIDSSKEDDIKILEGLNLESIRFINYNDSKTESISKIKTLKSLELNNTEITEIGNISNLVNLENLTINNSNINSLNGIEKLEKLKTVGFNNNEISDITELANNEELQVISLKGNKGIDGNRNNYTGEKLEKLNKIGKILDRGGIIYLDKEQLGLFTNYKKLNLSSQGLKNLEILEGMTELETLNLSYNGITLEDEKSREILSSMQKLKNLNVSGNPMIDIKPINNLKSLEVLELRSSNINLKDIEDIISNINLIVINWSSLINCESSKITKLKSSSFDINEIPNLNKFDRLEEIEFSYGSIVQKDSIKNISEVENLKKLTLRGCNLEKIVIDFSKLTNLTTLDLSNNTLWDEDLENLKALKNNSNLTINLSNNAIINATVLLELNPNTNINLSGNVNLTKEAKEKLKVHFQERVTF